MKREFNLLKIKDVAADKIDDAKFHFYYDMVVRSKGKILGDNTKGYIFLDYYQTGYSVFFIYVFPQWRNKGVAHSLLDSAYDYCKHIHKLFALKAIGEDLGATILCQFAAEKKMTKGSHMKIYICDRSKPLEKIFSQWYDKIKPFQERFFSHGVILSKFKETPKKVIDTLRSYFTVWDESRLVPFDFHFDNYFNVEYDYSFVCYKDDEPLSYIICTRYGDSLIMQEMGTVRSHWLNGTILLCVIPAIQQAIADRSLNKVSFMHLSTNVPMNRLYKKWLSPFHSRFTEQQIFYVNYKPIKRKKDIEAEKVEAEKSEAH